MSFLANHPMVANYDLSAVTDIITSAAPVSPGVYAKVQDLFNKPDLSIRQCKFIWGDVGPPRGLSSTVNNMAFDV